MTIALCSILGLPWFVAATVLALTHINSLKVMSENAAPGERPIFMGIILLLNYFNILELLLIKHASLEKFKKNTHTPCCVLIYRNFKHYKSFRIVCDINEEHLENTVLYLKNFISHTLLKLQLIEQLKFCSHYKI